MCHVTARFCPSPPSIFVSKFFFYNPPCFSGFPAYAKSRSRSCRTVHNSSHLQGAPFIWLSIAVALSHSNSASNAVSCDNCRAQGDDKMDALYSKILVFHFFMKSLTKHCGFVPLRPFQLMSRERDITMYCPPLTRKDLNLRVSIESLFPGITVRQKKKKKKKNCSYC